MSIWVIFIISLVVATIIVNSTYQLFMKMMGASGMYYSAKKKLIAIVVIALFLSEIVYYAHSVQAFRSWLCIRSAEYCASGASVVHVLRGWFPAA